MNVFDVMVVMNVQKQAWRNLPGMMQVSDSDYRWVSQNASDSVRYYIL